MRKVIQISTESHLGDYYVLTALCDDGTIWEKTNSGLWTLTESIPQPHDANNVTLPKG